MQTKSPALAKNEPLRAEPASDLYSRVDTLRHPCDGACSRPEAAATAAPPLVNANTAIRMVGVALGFLFVQDSSTLTRAWGGGRTKRIKIM